MSTMKFYKKDQIISSEGEKAKNIFVLVDGQVGIFKENRKISEFSKPGEIFGELSMILNRPRTATIKALTDCNLLAVEGELDELVKLYPDISKKLIKTLAERLANSTD
ncbi:MAG: cyclic nucleotide-binding domain-containing protein [Melioribacteraceae bacterium]